MARRLLPLLLATCLLAGVAAVPPAGAAPSPLAGDGMWIWNIANTEKGDPARIAARAKKAGFSFVVVKAANGASAWPGFTAAFVAALQAQGLKVCGYQRVLTGRWSAQATVLARQLRLGADCGVIDAESEVEGRYWGAARYLKVLRDGVGRSYPLALTSFPWIGYHPAFPYSVFLAPGGAQTNMPQIYWKDIGVSVSRAFSATYPSNSVYGRPIRPIGQLYQAPARREILDFRAQAAQYGADGVSWWVWEQANSTGWKAVSDPLAVPELARVVTPPTVGPGWNSDLVRWVRLRLKARGMGVRLNDSRYDSALAAAVSAFQAKRGLPVTGTVTPATWAVLKPVYRAG